MAVLDRLDVAGGETLAVADAVDVVDDRHFGIAAEQEIGVQRMRRPRRHIVDGAAGRDQRLADDLAAEHPLPARLRRTAAKQIHFERFEIENINQFLDGGGHAVFPRAGAVPGARLLAYRFGGGSSPTRTWRARIGHDTEQYRRAGCRRRLCRADARHRVAAGARIVVRGNSCRSDAGR